MGQGNVIALKKTLDSFKGIVDEVVYGDLLIFQEDREVVKGYQWGYNLRMISLPFNYIFQMGFSSLLNYLISNAKNDMVMYMNTSEVIDEDYGINKIIDGNPDCNAFYFSHRVEKHRWFRCFDRRFAKWDGRIHEEPIGDNVQPYHKPIFMMKDEEKDMGDKFKADTFNSVKEMTYWNQLIKIVDNPKEKGVTNEYWVKFAKEQYQSMKDRLVEKGNQYEAFKIGDYEMFMNDIYTSDYFKTAKFESSNLLNFQGARKDIL
jgi:hypothetical protein